MHNSNKSFKMNYNKPFFSCQPFSDILKVKRLSSKKFDVIVNAGKIKKKNKFNKAKTFP